MATIEINEFIKSFESAFGKPKSDIKEVINAYYKGQDYSGMTDAVQIVDAYVLYGNSMSTKSTFFERVVERMKECDWEEKCDGDTVRISHPEAEATYENWEDAIMSCINKASNI